MQFLKRLMLNQKQPISLIVDGHRAHFTKPVQEFIKTTKGKLKIYQLPSYSPELNPDEFVWNNAKQKVSKRKHSKTRKSFTEVVNETMKKIQRDKDLLKAFFCQKDVRYAM